MNFKDPGKVIDKSTAINLSQKFFVDLDITFWKKAYISSNFKL